MLSNINWIIFTTESSAKSCLEYDDKNQQLNMKLAPFFILAYLLGLGAWGSGMAGIIFNFHLSIISRLVTIALQLRLSDGILIRRLLLGTAV